MTAAKFKYGDRVTHVWPRSNVAVTGRIVASTERDITIADDRGHEHTIPHGTFDHADHNQDDAA